MSACTIITIFSLRLWSRLLARPLPALRESRPKPVFQIIRQYPMQVPHRLALLLQSALHHHQHAPLPTPAEIAQESRGRLGRPWRRSRERELLDRVRKATATDPLVVDVPPQDLRVPRRAPLDLCPKRRLPAEQLACAVRSSIIIRTPPLSGELNGVRPVICPSALGIGGVVVERLDMRPIV